MPFFEQEKLLDASVHVGADVVPRVTRIVLLDVGPCVAQVPAAESEDFLLLLTCENLHIHFSGFGSDISKCIENMGQFLGGQILWIVVSSVDRLYSQSAKCPDTAYIAGFDL